MNGKIVLALALMLVAGAIIFANSNPVAAADPYSNSCVQASASEGRGLMTFFQQGPLCNKPGTCTPGQTFCEDRSVGARMTTCTAAGTWGPWAGCGRHSSCDVGGLGGKC